MSLENKPSQLQVNRSASIEGIHKFTGTLKFTFYGEPALSTTDVFRYQLIADFEEDPGAMLEGIRWESHPIDIVTWQKGSMNQGEFTPEDVEL